MIRTLVFGAGRMARRVLAKLNDSDHFEASAVVSRNQGYGLAAKIVSLSLEEIDTHIDLLIDFTLPGGTRTAAQWCEHTGAALLSGTTGLEQADLEELDRAALRVPVLWAPNMSIGVALLTSLVGKAAAALGPEASVRINDIHHEHKIDAPSGTALALASTVLQQRADLPNDLLERAQASDIAQKTGGKLGFSSVREGEVIGEHHVRFSVAGEQLELRHSALDRDVFADGALKAGRWLVAQPAGRYTCADWLGMDI